MPGQYSFPFSALLVYKLLAKIDHLEAKITSAEVVIRVAKPMIVRTMHTFALGAATSDDRPADFNKNATSVREGYDDLPLPIEKLAVHMDKQTGICKFYPRCSSLLGRSGTMCSSHCKQLHRAVYIYPT